MYGPHTHMIVVRFITKEILHAVLKVLEGEQLLIKFDTVSGTPCFSQSERNTHIPEDTRIRGHPG